MDLPTITDELKGALAGGFTAALLEGTRTRGIVNGATGVAMSISITPGVVDSLYMWVPSTPSVREAAASIFALVGVIVAEFLQRVCRRFLSRSEDLADRAIDHIPGAKGPNRENHEDHS